MLMASEEGDGMRRRAAELGRAIRRSADGSGVSRAELDSFISHIARQVNNRSIVPQVGPAAC